MASIQPRTSLSKFAKDYPTVKIKVRKNIGGLESQTRQLKEAVLFPLLYPDLMKATGVRPGRGLLFTGPPGTGKTHMVRSMAGALRKMDLPVSLFIKNGADILSKWIGEAEQNIRNIFETAKKRAPSIIFFDEIDGLAPVRGTGNRAGALGEI